MLANRKLPRPQVMLANAQKILSAQTALKILSAYFLLMTAAYLGVAVLSMAQYSLVFPVDDAWDFYDRFVTMPFPDSVIAPHNGHRTVVPNLVRIAELQFPLAKQQVQRVVGTGSTLMAIALLWAVSWRERTLPVWRRSAAVMVSTIAVIWMGNSPMFLYIFEQMHVQFTIFLVIASLVCLTYGRDRHYAWLLVAVILAVLASLSLGQGTAALPALILLALPLRYPLRWMLGLIAGFLALGGIYVFLLPNSQSFQDQLGFYPFDSLMTMSRWLSGPWIEVWVRSGEVPEYASIARPPSIVGRTLIATAQWALHLVGGGYGVHESHCYTYGRAAMRLGAIIGFSGLAMLGACYLHAWRRGRETLRLQAVGLGLALFTALDAALVAVTRAHGDCPSDNNFGGRYFAWMCLFWLGLCLYALGLKNRSRVALLSAAALSVGPIALWPSEGHYVLASAWNYRVRELALMSTLLGGSDKVVSTTENPRIVESQRLLEARRGAFYSDPRFGLFGQRVECPRDGASTSVAIIQPSVPNYPNDVLLSRLGGALPPESKRPKWPTMLVVDDQGIVSGFAQAFVDAQFQPPLLTLADRTALDGYIRRYDAHKRYHLVTIDPTGRKCAPEAVAVIDPGIR